MDHSSSIDHVAKFWSASKDNTDNTFYVDFAINLKENFYRRKYKFVDYPMSMSVRCINV
jgi:uncharacterized protein (TIGR02145 family)